jgi:hypothetical protein
MEKVQKMEQITVKKLIKDENDKMTREIRQKRLAFIENSYPIVVKEIIKIALKSKLNSVKNSNVRKIAKNQKFTACFSPFCNGKINSLGACNTCSTNYCLQCDKKRDKKDHTCLKEDLETKEFMSKVITCPTCKVPVEKISGCNYITCALCRTNFSYTNGAATVAGNHDRTFLRLKERNFNDILDAVRNESFKHSVITKFLRLQPEYITKSQVKTPFVYEKYIVSQSLIHRINEVKAILYTEYDKEKTITYATLNQLQKKFNL